MDGLPFVVLVVIFLAAAAVVWVAGIQLSKATDVLDARLHLGSALGGLIVLAVATNLPEIAITVSAALSGNLDVAVGNILGGIALQTVVLVVLDLFGKRGKGAKPLTYRAASLTLVLEGLVVVAVLAVVIAGSQLPSGLEVLRLTPDVVLIAGLWVVGLLLVQRSGKHLPWHEDGRAPDATASPSKKKTHPMSTRKATIVFTISAAATLLAGVVLERAGDAASSQLGLSGVLFGATVLALATSLPEISTGLQAIKQGDDNLAISDIFGGNAFLPVLFLVATVLSGTAVLPQANSSDIYLTALAALLTLVYIVGLIFRPTRRIAGMGIDSLIVLALYTVGIAGLFAITAT
ncbi:sodium:proton exchanger [Rathayibacter sp. AY1E8]|jgi:cation:H+ antiporter|uniref:sodium:calcium antiporter n=1 Tax=unclassified Rathayibacter TaxID=2609250 RepID=UPI000CE8740F|nr:MULTISPECIES: sodium:proton exchanger [unclassified Rathayibacter]PPG19879.1 sodium:proton exchanger [Rathayibacter sp. AY1E8]PPG84676.1 sodium:proton exchanger [Rathayibacter sp. AY1H2]PPH35859.1 sodium:proton exchanger [Rathayibacter sp. AY1E3]PPH98562.1 sodium:proton exchanger [Rathayibacter sp. AY1D1]